MYKAVIAAAVIALGLTLGAHAQNYQFYDRYGNQAGHASPNFGGGYNFYDRYGNQDGSARPNFGGGYNFYDRYGNQTGSQRANPW